jgi:hypothetical protein
MISRFLFGLAALAFLLALAHVTLGTLDLLPLGLFLLALGLLAADVPWPTWRRP